MGATVRVCVHVAIVCDTGWGETGWENGPRGDWRDGSVGPQVISGGWEVVEPAEGCEAIMEVFAVTVSHWELGCEPNRHEGRHEDACLVGDGEFVDNKEDRVNVRHRDALICNEFRNGEELGELR